MAEFSAVDTTVALDVMIGSVPRAVIRSAASVVGWDVFRVGVEVASVVVARHVGLNGVRWVKRLPTSPVLYYTMTQLWQS